MRTTGDGTWLRAAALGALLALGTLLALTVELPSVGTVRSWVDGAGTVGWTAMVLGLGLMLLAPVPRSALSILAGLVAGFWPGLAVALAGGLLGGLIAFGLSRILGRTAATRLAGPRFGRVDELMTERGFVAVLGGRLLPMIPFVVLSYGAGLTAVRWVPYAAATALGLLPSTVIQVGIGASAGAVVDHATPLTILSVLAAALLLGVFAAGAWHRRRRPAAESCA